MVVWFRILLVLAMVENTFALPLRIQSGLDAGWDGGSDFQPGAGLFPGTWPRPAGNRIRIETGMIYDSNALLNESLPQQDWGIWMRPEWSYRSHTEDEVPVLLSAGYSPHFSRYAENRTLDASDQNAELKCRFNGARTLLELFSRYRELSCTDPLTGVFSQTRLVGVGVSADRRIRANTSLHGAWTSHWLRYDQRGLSGANTQIASCGMMLDRGIRWKWGPSLRFSRSDGEDSSRRSSMAALFSCQGRPGERERVVVELGPEWVETDWNGLADRSWGVHAACLASMDIGGRSRICALIQQVQVPSSESGGRPLDTTSLELTLERSMEMGRAYAGLGCLLYRFEEPDGIPAPQRGTEITPSIWIGLEKNLADTNWLCRTSVTLSANDGREDWRRLEWQVGIAGTF